MNIVGHVHIANDRLWAWCDKCEAEIQYEKGQRAGEWAEELVDFRNGHRDCKKAKEE